MRGVDRILAWWSNLLPKMRKSSAARFCVMASCAQLGTALRSVSTCFSNFSGYSVWNTHQDWLYSSSFWRSKFTSCRLERKRFQAALLKLPLCLDCDFCLLCFLLFMLHYFPPVFSLHLFLFFYAFIKYVHVGTFLTVNELTAAFNCRQSFVYFCIFLWLPAIFCCIIHSSRSVFNNMYKILLGKKIVPCSLIRSSQFVLTDAL